MSDAVWRETDVGGSGWLAWLRLAFALVAPALGGGQCGDEVCGQNHNQVLL
jgi:hypothetical protein